METTPTALGREIRRRRFEAVPRLSQERLGVAAGYGTGAGVSMSRIEGGETTPTQERLAGIARALGTTPEELVYAANLNRNLPKSERADKPGKTGAPTLRQRAEAIELEVARRSGRVTELATSYGTAHELARDKFFLEFVAVGASIEGAPESSVPPEAPPADSADPDHSGDAPSRRVAYASNVVASKLAGTAAGGAAGAATGTALAYGTFTAAAAFGTASTGTAISGLSGVAATNATLAALGGGSLAAGGAGVAGGVIVLGAIVAAPLLLLGAGGFLWMHKRSKLKAQEAKTAIDEAESALTFTKYGFEALEAVLIEATSSLETVGVHGARALDKWKNSLPASPVRWSDLSSVQQQAYNQFSQVAGAQLTITSIDAAALMSLRGRELLKYRKQCSSDLKDARETIERWV